MTVTINASTSSGLVQTADTSGALDLQTNGTTALGFDTSGVLSFNSGYGSAAKAYGCRAWVNFNGTGTVAIRASGNVSSITDNGTGLYTVNFTTAMPDTNYSVAGFNNGNNDTLVASDSRATYPITSTSSIQVRTVRISDGALQDNAFVSLQIFR
jgi:hypothetical protein